MAESISPDLGLVARGSSSRFGSPTGSVEGWLLQGYELLPFLLFPLGRERACGRRLVGVGGRNCTAAGDISSSFASVKFGFRDLTPGELLSLAAACRESDVLSSIPTIIYRPQPNPLSTRIHDLGIRVGGTSRTPESLTSYSTESLLQLFPAAGKKASFGVSASLQRSTILFPRVSFRNYSTHTRAV